MIETTTGFITERSPHVITPEIAERLARPLPALHLPADGDATEVDLIRLCGQAIALRRDREALCCFFENAPPAPPASITGRIAAIDARFNAASEMASLIPATTLDGLKAKARAALSEHFDYEWSSLDGQQLVVSLLADLRGLPTA